MADDVDILLKMYDEQRIQARQSEDQRSTITNITMIIASTVLGFIAQSEFTFANLPLTILLIAIGVYGAIASEKLYERFQHHRTRASYFRKKLDELSPKIHFLKLQSEADKIHQKEFPRLIRIRLHHVWLSMHIAIAVAGIVLTIILLVRNFLP